MFPSPSSLAPRKLTSCLPCTPVDLVAQTFAMVVLVSDNFLSVTGAGLTINTGRFFALVARLPLELQMTVCRRVFHLPGDIIQSQLTEVALKSVLKDIVKA